MEHRRIATRLFERNVPIFSGAGAPAPWNAFAAAAYTLELLGEHPEVEFSRAQIETYWRDQTLASATWPTYFFPKFISVLVESGLIQKTEPGANGNQYTNYRVTQRKTSAVRRAYKGITNHHASAKYSHIGSLSETLRIVLAHKQKLDLPSKLPIALTEHKTVQIHFGHAAAYVIEYALKQPRITTSDLIRLIQIRSGYRININAIRRLIVRLVELGILTMHGTASDAYYQAAEGPPPLTMLTNIRSRLAAGTPVPQSLDSLHELLVEDSADLGFVKQPDPLMRWKFKPPYGWNYLRLAQAFAIGLSKYPNGITRTLFLKRLGITHNYQKYRMLFISVKNLFQDNGLLHQSQRGRYTRYSSDRDQTRTIRLALRMAKRYPKSFKTNPLFVTQMIGLITDPHANTFVREVQLQSMKPRLAAKSLAIALMLERHRMGISTIELYVALRLFTNIIIAPKRLGAMLNRLGIDSYKSADSRYRIYRISAEKAPHFKTWLSTNISPSQLLSPRVPLETPTTI